MQAIARAERSARPDTRDAAREYMARGWSPIPVPARAKNPNRPGWQNERHTIDDVDGAFDSEGNIGLLLGEASDDLCDVDLDCDETIAAAPFFLPHTDRWHGRASHRRSHAWYVVTDEPSLRRVSFVDPTRKDTNGKACTLVELRANGHQTIVPPSLHDETGELITWESEGEPARVTAGELRVAVAKVAACALIAWRWPDGARHDAALALAGLLLRGGMAPHDAEHFVEAVARVAGDDEWRDRVRCVPDTAQSIAAGEAATGGPRLADLLADGPMVVSKLREWLQLRAALEEGTQPSIRIVNIAEFLTLEMPPRETILSPWLPTQGLVMIDAERGVGKTFFALCAAYAAATGTPFLRFEATKPWRVLYLDGEMPAVVLQERLSSIVAATASEPPCPDHFRLITPDLQTGAMIDLTQAASHAALAPCVDTADLVIADNISTLCGGNENEAEDWRPIAAWGLMLRRARKSLVLIHHAGKNGEQRGISKREDILDSVLVLKRPRDYQPEQGARFEVHFKKHRGFYGDTAKPFEASLGTDNTGGNVWTMRSLDDCLTERIVALHRDGTSQREIAKALDIGVATVNRHLQKAKGSGLL
jgi:hypothetical protein